MQTAAVALHLYSYEIKSRMNLTKSWRETKFIFHEKKTFNFGFILIF